VGDNFAGGVIDPSLPAGRAAAQIAVQKRKIVALTGKGQSFEIDLGNCALSRTGDEVRCANGAGTTVVWSVAPEIWGALRGVTTPSFALQFQRLDRTRRRWGVARPLLVVGVAAALLTLGAPRLARVVLANAPSGVSGDIGRAAWTKLGVPDGLAPETERAITRIAERLSARSSRRGPLNVRVSGYSDATSFALPGGTIVVNAGLLCAVAGPDELAAVLAREIAHSNLGHPLARLAPLTDLEATGRALFGSVDELASLALDLVSAESKSAYSDAMEADARREAETMFVAAGFRGPALSELLARLEKAPPRGSSERRFREALGVLATELPKGDSAVAMMPLEIDWEGVRRSACELSGQ
jgi:uncharacterized membrane protein